MNLRLGWLGRVETHRYHVGRPGYLGPVVWWVVNRAAVECVVGLFRHRWVLTWWR